LYICVVLFFFGETLIAAYAPMRRGWRLDPAAAMRFE
jgi:hypothetical protein